MEKDKQPPLTARVLAVRERVDDWRKSRPRPGPMPEALWRAAVRLARTQGVNPIARALRLDYYSLKRRLAAGHSPKVSKAGPEAGFVELDLSQAVAAPQYVVELVDRGGAKLTVRLSGREPVDILALSEAFWKRR